MSKIEVTKRKYSPDDARFEAEYNFERAFDDIVGEKCISPYGSVTVFASTKKEAVDKLKKLLLLHANDMIESTK